MTILSEKLILKRILVGISEISEENILKLKEKFGVNEAEKKDTLDEIAKNILNDKHDKRKFNDLYNKCISKEEIIKKIETKYYEMKDDKKKDLAHKEELPIFLNDFDIDNLQSANYDLRLGKECYVTTEKHPKDLEKSGGILVIEPGEFGILTTHEYVYLPDDVFGFISLRYRYKRLGLINISGFHVDPGYCGIIIFSVYNAGPKSVVLRYEEPVFMIMFDKLKEPVLKGYDPNKGYENIPVDVVQALKGPTVNIISLDKRLKSLEMQLKLLYGLLIGILIAIIAAIIRYRG